MCVMEEKLTEQQLVAQQARELELRQNLRLKSLIDHASQRLQGDRGVEKGTFAPSQRRVLCMLAMHGEMTQQRLLDELELAPASLSEVVNKLAEKELVTRNKLESDRRIVVIALTPAGHAVADEMLAADNAAINSAFAHFTPEEKQQLEDLLDRLSVPVG